MLTRDLLHSYGWCDDQMAELALTAAESLMGSGLGQDAAVVWLDQVCAEPRRYLDDPVLAPLARECLRRTLRAITHADELYSPALAAHN